MYVGLSERHSHARVSCSGGRLALIPRRLDLTRTCAPELSELNCAKLFPGLWMAIDCSAYVARRNDAYRVKPATRTK